MHKIRIGTRGSKLALIQADFIQSLLNQQGMQSSIEVIKTTGDIDRSSPFTEMKESSLFTKEIEHALLHKEVDIAVHSLKDLSSSFPEGLDIAAYTGPRSRGDAFVSLKYKSLNDVPAGSSIGTSSPRRQACLMSFSNKVRVKPIRGNVPTRLKKLERGEYDAILLAAAGLERLGLEETIREYLAGQSLRTLFRTGYTGSTVQRG